MGYKAFERLRTDPKVKVEKYQSDDYQLLGPSWSKVYHEKAKGYNLGVSKTKNGLKLVSNQ